MKKLITAFFMSWGMFCAVPCPYPHWDEDMRPMMVALLPFIGLLCGAVWLLADHLIRLIGLSGLFAALLRACVPWLMTGFIHLDGYMDCCDAIMSRRGLEERQRILKDPHTGAFAVICLVLLCLCNVSLFSAWDGRRALALLFIPAAVRCCSSMAVINFKPISHSSYGKNFADGVRPVHTLIPAFTLVASWLLCLFIGGSFAAPAASAAAFAAILHCRRQLGGMSGDISGFAITVGETAGLLILTLTGI
ncbi:MAG: adenosylcobinamide-GDP ribazoletransferase [Oscillospiraceae bacterium]|nr:adenosylcobinamide-GDP ribazoletransferase [Oscillospiraceae bacterium]